MDQNFILFMTKYCSSVWLYHILFIHSCATDAWWFPPLAVVSSATVNTNIQVPVWVPPLASIGCVSRSGIVGSWGYSVCSSLRSRAVVVCQSSFIVLTCPPVMYGQFPHIFTSSCFFLPPSPLPSCFFTKIIAILEIPVESLCGFNLHFSLMINDVEYFSCVYCCCMSSLEKYLFETFTHLSVGLSFCCWVLEFLCVFCILSLHQICNMQYFSHFVGCPIHF